MNEIQTFYTYLKTQEAAKDFLYMSYQHENITDAEVKSYKNCQAFVYYLDHGLRFYDNGRCADAFIQPILYFYGMTHLLKACLLAKRPDYPESVSMLAHGVTTRKRKKKDYNFLDDEVKIQVHGLFPYFTEHLYTKELLHFEKINMQHLLSLIPEMNQLFSLYHGDEPMIQIADYDSNILTFPTSILDHYQVTENTFLRRIKTFLPDIDNCNCDQSSMVIKLKGHPDTKLGPFFVHGKDKSIYFPYSRENYLPIAEVMIHYLLLYNLSMLSRYETEWWGELFATKTDKDYSFITHFLSITAEKVPQLLGHELLERFHK